MSALVLVALVGWAAPGYQCAQASAGACCGWQAIRGRACFAPSGLRLNPARPWRDLPVPWRGALSGETSFATPGVWPWRWDALYEPVYLTFGPGARLPV